MDQNIKHIYTIFIMIISRVIYNIKNKLLVLILFLIYAYIHHGRMFLLKNKYKTFYIFSCIHFYSLLDNKTKRIHLYLNEKKRQYRNIRKDAFYNKV